jgi:hypothetical protein
MEESVFMPVKISQMQKNRMLHNAVRPVFRCGPFFLDGRGRRATGVIGGRSGTDGNKKQKAGNFGELPAFFIHGGEGETPEYAHNILKSLDRARAKFHLLPHLNWNILE